MTARVARPAHPVVAVVGDPLLDWDLVGHVQRLCPDDPAAPVLEDAVELVRPGGAALAALLAHRAGAAARLVCPLSDDPGSKLLRRLLEAEGIEVVAEATPAPLAEKRRLRTGNRTLLRLDTNSRAGEPPAHWHPDTLAALEADAVLVADYGRGCATAGALRGALDAARQRGTPLVWDPHPRGAPPVPGCQVITPNETEALAAAGVAGPEGRRLADLVGAGRHLLERWRPGALAVTRGRAGILLLEGDGLPMVVPPPQVAQLGDTCGAGDAFAAAVAVALGEGAIASEAVHAAAAAAAAFVDAGGASALAHPVAACPAPPPQVAPGGASRRPTDEPRRALEAARQLVAAVRARGGCVVAAGGCFDLLHAGHVSLLEQARALGDCLVVCVNADASVARAKGPNRPLVPLADRVAVLSSLACVDAVVPFDEDTPVACLERLSPDLFVKGGDYLDAHVPEEAALAATGGQVVVVSYLKGRSTSRLARSMTTSGGPQ